MAHGAPDHTRLEDDAFSHYEDNWSTLPWGGLAAGDPANYIVNVDMVGLLGDIYILTTNPMVTLKIAVDDVGIYSWDIATLVSLGLWSYSNPQFRMTCTKYDAVIGLYAMLFTGGNQIYVHHKLQAWLVRSLLGDNGAGYCWYKER